MGKEVWSVKCSCGAIKTISEKLRNEIVEHQTAPAPFPPSEWRESLKDENGFMLSLSCDSCDKSIEHSWSMIMHKNPHTNKRDRPDTEPGHVGIDRDEDGSESFIGLYVTPNSWVKGTTIETTRKPENTSTSRQSDVSDGMCPKCGSEMEPFMIAGGASMTIGGPNSGKVSSFGSEEGYECTNCGYEEMD